MQLNLDKSGQNADYTTTPLAQNLWTYGATDGWVSRRLAETLLDLVKRKTTTGSIQEPPSMALLSEGTEVKIPIGGRFVAKAIVIFVGGLNGAQTTFCDKFTVGKGRAIVKLVEVFQPSAKVPFPKANPAWTKKTTLGWIFSSGESPGHEIVVRTSNLTVLLDVDSQSRNDTQSVVPGGGTVTANDQSEQHPAEGASGQTLPEKYQAVVGESGDGGSSSFVPDHGGAFDDMLLESNSGCDDEPDGPVSRLHEDLFHQIKNLPIPKTCAVKVKIIQLLILASTHFVEEDYLRLAKVLMEKWGVKEEELLDHFQFNKEYWRERVRMPTFPPEEHACNIQMVHNFVEKALGKDYTEDVKKYFEKFERDCRNGLYAELEDVSMYRQVGVDSDGLDLWIRLKGSVRCENIHRTMSNALGPHAMGAEVAHFLLILICFRYNVNLGVRRKGRPNFGHIHLYINDEVQILVQEIYNVIIYPGHTNFSLYEAPKDNSVGLCKLIAFVGFVQQGEPLECLTPDQRFIAKQMGVQCPPLPPSGKQEMQMLNEFYQRNPSATDRQFENLAREFLDKADGKEIFPKLPSMLKADFGRWKRSSNLRWQLLN